MLMYMPSRSMPVAHGSVPESERGERVQLVSGRDCARHADRERVAAKIAGGRLDRIGAGTEHRRRIRVDGAARVPDPRAPGRVPPLAVRSQSNTAVACPQISGAGTQRSRASARKFEPVGVASEPTTRLDERAACGSGAGRVRIAFAVRVK